MSVSVIIPTYKNVEFISELVNSITTNQYDEEYEVLIGIDNCSDTLNYIYENKFPPNFKFFYFTENKGPYIIKNTLTLISKFDKIIFFDSDDVMMPNLLKEVDLSLDSFTLIKPKYINFTDNNGLRTFKDEKSQYGEGVFGIHKDVFLNMNGFEGWEVAADSDFMGRLYKTKTKVLHTVNILFHRRNHSNSLTIHPETGLASRLRGQYFTLSRKKTSDNIINEKLVKGNYKIVDLENKTLIKNDINLVEELEPTEAELKKQRHESIGNIFSNQPKTTILKNDQKTINYNSINLRGNHKISSQLGNALKKAKLEEIKRGSRR